MDCSAKVYDTIAYTPYKYKYNVWIVPQRCMMLSLIHPTSINIIYGFFRFAQYHLIYRIPKLKKCQGKFELFLIFFKYII